MSLITIDGNCSFKTWIIHGKSVQWMLQKRILLMNVSHLFSVLNYSLSVTIVGVIYFLAGV